MSQQSPVRHAAAQIDTTQAADLIITYLEQMGVEYIFGVPGGAIEPLYNALARSERRGGIRPIVARHEAGAAFMADGYARETGKLGVCCATSGPGATNLLTGVACALDNAIPMLVITGQPSLPLFGKGALQESSCTGINTLGMFQQCTVYNTLVSHPAQMEAKLMTAIQRAIQARGPAHLSIPLDILKSPLPTAPMHCDLVAKTTRPRLFDADATHRLHQMLEQGSRTRLLIGGGAGEAISEIIQIAAHYGIPFATTPDGKGLVNTRHPLYRGVFGFAGHQSARDLLRDPESDITLAVGVSMNEWTSGVWSDFLLNEKLIHVDESAAALARSPMAKLHVRGRIQTIFQQLLALSQPRPNTITPVGYLDTETSHCTLASKEQYASPATPITPQRVMNDLGRRFPPTTRFLADAGNSFAWAIHYLALTDHRTSERRNGNGLPRGENNRQTSGGWLRLTMDFAPMGWAIGGAIGTAAANRKSPVVCITGDGSMLMSGQELSVAVAEGLTVIFVVLNDQALGMVKHGQRLAGAERIAFELPPTDFAAMARALGAEAATIYSPEDMEALDLDAICARKGPTLLDVHIDPEQVPPINIRMQVLGTEL